MINFLKYRSICLVASCVMIAAGVAGYIHNGGFRFSVDFTGGTQVLCKFSKPVGSEHIKEAMMGAGWADPLIREFENNEVAIRVFDFANDSQGLAHKIRDTLEAQSPDVKVEILEVNAVGAGVGETLRLNALLMGL